MQADKLSMPEEPFRHRPVLISGSPRHGVIATVRQRPWFVKSLFEKKTSGEPNYKKGRNVFYDLTLFF